ncbi:PREDICTED: uncharacterized protein LOC109178857 [Ipomoea nil]|uniref:uncharacterized protein LOC109178857 n=1 Tax=Ipomoea nil TaxID=35883 RepID=UPI00090199BE|nr:PREDICTED: uncharacterized protein LOC109178857 [Ipomoea nil]
MVEWKDEIMELLRLNQPPPPSMEQPSVHGQPPPPQQSPGECSVDPGRRPGKEPAREGQVEVEEVSDEDEGLPEHHFGFHGIPEPVRPGLARRVHFGARAGHHNPGGEQGMRYKHEFPVFDYENPRLWVIRCERFFMLARIPREEILHILCVNLTGKVALWYEGYLNGLREGFQWPLFARAVCKRFCQSDVDVMEEFSTFKQWGNVVEFSDKFEEYKGLLLQVYPFLTDQYFLDSFVVRLKQQLRCFVRTSKPENLEDAIWVARQFEKRLKVSEPQKNTSHSNLKTTSTFQKNQSYPKPYSQKNPEPNRSQFHQSSLKTTASNTPQTYTKSTEVSRFKSQLREQNKCFKCFEPWNPGHKCKGPTFNIIEEFESPELEEENKEDQPEEEEAVGDSGQDEAEVTLCAVIGGEGMNTIKLMGTINRQTVVILVDCGSTHSFLDPRILNQLKITPAKASPLTVTIANGDKLVCDSVCCGIRWTVNGEEFEKDFRLLRLGGCDMVLGMDWIDTYAPIQLHTRPPSISFHKEGKKVLLKGMSRKAALQQVSKKELRRWQKEGVQGFLVHGTSYSVQGNISVSHHQKPDPHQQELTAILQEFHDLFDEPKTLPPHRPFDHEIPLIPSTKPVNIKPYRYSYLQKNIIEKMVEEMLSAGIITPSTSSFASPVLLVPKKDNSWRFCIDYRALNEITIKNKFPIPLVEDLFSELASAKVFTKLDLRSGYHQVRMKKGEEHKTAFKTHQGLYEFIVMPFGLTNAPATFQALMNFVFKSLIRKSVLVFFDDILVYSSSFEDHWRDLREVLGIMKDHQLLAKMSKCTFATSEVEYLGHIISEHGLKTDPAKLTAVAAWPKPTSVKGLRGFLGLTGYYRRFIKAYGTISRPLTNMLKKDAFQWSNESEVAFEELKKALCTAPVLTLPDFNKEFVVEADACYKGMGAVLMQGGKPVAYFSKGFGNKHLGLSIYEKEYLSIINAVDKWRPYLIGGHFIIRTDHQSLKFLLEQKITTTMQQKGLTKLLGLSYTIQYKKGVDNCVADALSRRDNQEQAELLAVSTVRPMWIEEILKSYEKDELASKLLPMNLIAPNQDSLYTVIEGLIKYKGRLYIGSNGELRSKLIAQMHHSPIGGHSGQ